MLACCAGLGAGAGAGAGEPNNLDQPESPFGPANEFSSGAAFKDWFKSVDRPIPNLLPMGSDETPLFRSLPLPQKPCAEDESSGEKKYELVPPGWLCRSR